MKTYTIREDEIPQKKDENLCECPEPNRECTCYAQTLVHNSAIDLIRSKLKPMESLDEGKIKRKIRLQSLACEVDRISVLVGKKDYSLGRELNILYKKIIEREEKLAIEICSKFKPLNERDVVDILWDKLPKSFFVDLDFEEQEGKKIQKIKRMKEYLGDVAKAICSPSSGGKG